MNSSLLQQIGRTSRAMYCAFEAEVGQALPRWRILQALHEHKCATQKQLATQLSMDPGALTRQMKALEKDFLVERRSAPEDNRLTTVTLTKKGSDMFVALQGQRQAFLEKSLEGLPQDHLKTTMETLKLLEARFRKMMDGWT
ncbi:MAG: MarR family transcriptional regulator [Burkholderiales bacterium]|nr:MarR family transcriptional regulator [Burkholderiales bacterium]